MTRTPNLGGRPPYAWKPDQVSALRSMREMGRGIKRISSELGISEPTVVKKLRELGLQERPQIVQVQSYRTDASWDERVFESYADRKVRLARERAA